jgi:hypothetical protein
MIFKTKKWFLIDILYILIALSFSIYNFQNREYDWDLPGYLGCLFESEYPGNIEKIKNETYLSIRKEASLKQFDNLVGASSYRKVLFENADAFNEQLPYYQIKIGYNLLVRAFYLMGFSAPYSVLYLNSLLFFISILFFYFSLKAIYLEYPFFVFFASVLFSSLPVLHYLSRNATPDILLVLLLLVFANFIINNKNSYFIFFIIFLIMVSRPDYIIFGLSFYFFKILYEYFLLKKINVNNVIFIILIGTAYFLIIKYYNYPGWKHVFYDSFIYRRNYISDQNPEFSLKTYIDIILKGIVNMKKVILSSLFLTLSILYLSKNIWIKFVAVNLFLNIYLKFLFFPAAGEYRFYVPFIFALFLIFFKFNKINFSQLKQKY